MTSGGMLKTADEVLMIDKNTLNNRYKFLNFETYIKR